MRRPWHTSRSVCFALLCALVLGGCGSRTALSVDPMDASIADAGPQDAGPFDAGRPDAGRDGGPDAGRDAAASDAAIDAGDPGCATSAECTDLERPLCCTPESCPLPFCFSGAPPTPCAVLDDCGRRGVCIDDDCGRGSCVADCRLTDDCAAQGLICDDGSVCRFDCRQPGFAGCTTGLVCRDNGQCGVPLCAATGCGPQAECVEVVLSPQQHRFSGCRPVPCETRADCRAGGFCVRGGCSEIPGQCTRIPDPAPSSSRR